MGSMHKLEETTQGITLPTHFPDGETEDPPKVQRPPGRADLNPGAFTGVWKALCCPWFLLLRAGQVMQLYR